MIDNVKRVVRLMKYAHQSKLNLIVGLLFLVFGFFVKWIGGGISNGFDSIFFFMPGMFLCQILYGLDCAKMISSTNIKKWLTVYVPDIFVGGSTLLSLALYYLAGELREAYPLNNFIDRGFTESIGNAVFCAGMMSFILMCYMAACYKYYWISSLIFIFIMFAYGAVSAWFFNSFDGGGKILELTKGQGILAAVLLYIAGVIVSGIIRRGVYKVPMSKIAIGKFLGEQI